MIRFVFFMKISNGYTKYRLRMMLHNSMRITDERNKSVDKMSTDFFVFVDIVSTKLLVVRLSTGIIFLKNPGQKVQKTKNGTLRWYTNSASKNSLQNQVDHSDQKVL